MVYGKDIMSLGYRKTRVRMSSLADQKHLTFLELAELVLSETKRPMTYREIWDYSTAKGYDQRLGSSGQTPWATVSAMLSIDVRSNPKTKFGREGLYPTKYFLKGTYVPEPPPKEVRPTLEARLSVEDLAERQLHPFLAYFALANLQAHVKTIFHEKSKRGGYMSWLHPDLVGFIHPQDEWENDVIEFGSAIGENPVVLLSFEMKRVLTQDTLRDSFFEAVSNSSWANRGYLVAAEIEDDPTFRNDLRRLSQAHGIGIIRIDISDPDRSFELFPARHRPSLDWPTIDKLFRKSEDFEAFLDSVKRVVRGGRIRVEDFDKVPSFEDLVRQPGK